MPESVQSCFELSIHLSAVNCSKNSSREKIQGNGFPYKHFYFEPVCLPVKMASKTVIRPI